MINQELVNYLKEGKRRGYDINFLKNKLFGAKWSDEEINDAMNEINSGEKVVQPENMQKTLLENEEKKGFGFTKKIKLMKIAGIIGIIFLVLQVGFILYYIISGGAQQIALSSIGNTTTQTSSSLPITIVITFLILILIAFELYYLGFVVMGKKINSNLIKSSAKIFMVFPLISITLIAVSYFVLKSLYASASSTSNLGVLDINTLFNPVYNLGLVWLGFFSIFVIIQFLFAIGFIVNREKIKSFLILGLSQIILGICGAISCSFLGYLVIKLNGMSAEQFIGAITSGGDLATILSTMNIVSIITIILIPITTLFGMLSLFEASKKFEVEPAGNHENAKEEV